MDRIRITMPGPPRGKGRHRTAVINGRARQFPDKATEAYEANLGWLARKAMAGRAPSAGPVAVVVIATFGVPASWPQWRRDAALKGHVVPTGKPDGDNILKIVKDSLNAIVFGDDAQVVRASVAKFYGSTPGLDITIAPVAAIAGSHGTKADLEALLAGRTA